MWPVYQLTAEHCQTLIFHTMYTFFCQTVVPLRVCLNSFCCYSRPMSITVSMNNPNVQYCCAPFRKDSIIVSFCTTQVVINLPMLMLCFTLVVINYTCLMFISSPFGLIILLSAGASITFKPKMHIAYSPLFPQNL